MRDKQEKGESSLFLWKLFMSSSSFFQVAESPPANLLLANRSTGLLGQPPPLLQMASQALLPNSPKDEHASSGCHIPHVTLPDVVGLEAAWKPSNRRKHANWSTVMPHRHAESQKLSNEAALTNLSPGI
ncbi:hypothetical protein NQZ68_013902 [Dissostichus eleginoides]|nr:hypothetical protein NQZ68_013902 [Dissostichus eleginoides]